MNQKSDRETILNSLALADPRNLDPGKGTPFVHLKDLHFEFDDKDKLVRLRIKDHLYLASEPRERAA